MTAFCFGVFIVKYSILRNLFARDHLLPNCMYRSFAGYSQNIYYEHSGKIGNRDFRSQLLKRGASVWDTNPWRSALIPLDVLKVHRGLNSSTNRHLETLTVHRQCLNVLKPTAYRSGWLIHTARRLRKSTWSTCVLQCPCVELKGRGGGKEGRMDGGDSCTEVNGWIDRYEMGSHGLGPPKP